MAHKNDKYTILNAEKLHDFAEHQHCHVRFLFEFSLTDIVFLTGPAVGEDEEMIDVEGYEDGESIFRSIANSQSQSTHPEQPTQIEEFSMEPPNETLDSILLQDLQHSDSDNDSDDEDDDDFPFGDGEDEEGEDEEEEEEEEQDLFDFSPVASNAEESMDAMETSNGDNDDNDDDDKDSN